MLYSLYEAQHAALAPFRFFAEFSHGWLHHPFSPLAHLPLSRRLEANSDLFLRLTRRYEKPAWRIEGAKIEVALSKPFCNLVHFNDGTPRAGGTPAAAPGRPRGRR